VSDEGSDLQRALTLAAQLELGRQKGLSTLQMFGPILAQEIASGDAIGVLAITFRRDGPPSITTIHDAVNPLESVKAISEMLATVLANQDR